MTTATESQTVSPVRKTITVKTPPERAFRLFTSGFDSWWPRTHHIGKVPMKKAILETKVGGRCYTEQTDGSECDWGKVLVWEPPKRLLIAWMITHEWGFEPDAAKASEVEVLFSPDGSGGTRVDLEHRNFSRLGDGGPTMRKAVDGEGGWTTLLNLFAAQAEKETA